MEVSVPQGSSSNTNRIVSTVLHLIDVNSNTCQNIPISGDQTDLEGYLSDLLTEIRSKEQKRSYAFIRETTEFFSALKSYTEEPDLQANTFSENLAERLLDKEVLTDKRYGHLGSSGTGHVKKGSFLQFLYREGTEISYLGVKIEHQIFLDEEDFRKKIGISIANKIYKACKVDFDENKSPFNVFVYDTNSKPSTYWWSDFLELKELRNDAHNTREASREVIKVINRIEKKFPADHTILINSVISSFKQSGEMKYDVFLKDTIENYVPVDDNLKDKLPQIIEKLKELPKTKDFDTLFNLVPSEVSEKKRKYTLSKEITLSIENGIENISNKIWSERTTSGKHLVVIESSEGFKRFTLKDREL